MKKLSQWPVLCAIVVLAVACGRPQAFTAAEQCIIDRSAEVMYVTVIGADSTVLRTPSADLTPAELASDRLKTLMDKMYSTVTSPQQDGVGIAAPQVGIDKRVIWVQRFDKPGEPFECYLNPHLDSLWGEMTHGPEGCLSVPPMRGLVPRYSAVKVSYIHPETLEPRTETVEGYTAIIFQHECDHLDGTLYIDRADTVFLHASWKETRAQYDYSRPAWWPLKENQTN